MIRKSLTHIVRFLVPVLVVSLLTSCAASDHAGKTYIQRPALTVTDENTWFSYWQDQFDAMEGRVIAPSLDYPKEAHSAYDRAAQEWGMKVSDASTKTTLAWIVGSTAAGVLLYVVAIGASTH
jgi:hypothetical protein